MQPDCHEPHEGFFDSGILRFYINIDWATRRAHGHAFWNHPSGRRWIEGRFDQGIRCGRWNEWTDDVNPEGHFREYGAGEYEKRHAPSRLEGFQLDHENVILLNEEYGFRHWFWFPDRGMDLMVQWWSDLCSVEPWAYSVDALPGTLIEAQGELLTLWHELHGQERFVCGHIHEDDDSHLQVTGGKRVVHRGCRV